MNNSHDESVVVDTIVAGSAITMPLWAVNLNGWLHLFMAVVGSILLVYRLWKVLTIQKDQE